MAKSDPFLSLLNSIGFLPLRLPRADVTPLNLLEVDGKDLNLLGAMSSALVAPNGVQAPVIVQDIQAAQNIQSTNTSKVKVGVAVTILGNILKAITGQDLGISAAFEAASTLTFQFGDVSVDKVDIILLDRFLNQSDIDPNLRHVHDLLIQDKIGVITATAKAKKYVVTAQREDGTQVGVNVPVIQQVVGGSVDVQSQSSDNITISFAGTVPLVFGLQAIRISFNDQGKSTAFDELKPGKGALRKLAGNFIKPQALLVDVNAGNVDVSAAKMAARG